MPLSALKKLSLNCITSVIALSLTGLTVGALAQPKQGPWKFNVGDPNGKDQVMFNSDAPVEVITGHTSKIKGHISIDPSFKFDAKHPFNIRFDVDLTSIDTGIALRNEHMRDNFLQTDQYPKATFIAKSVTTAKKPTFDKLEVIQIQATGDFTIHGVTVKKTIPIKVTYIPEGPISKKRVKSGNMIRLQSTFPVKLEAHKIPVPEAVFLKLADTVNVTIDTVGTDGNFN